MHAESNQAQGENNPINHAQQHPVRCANCDIEILWTPTVVQGKSFCCAGCAADGPCSCDYSQYHSVNISGVIHYLE